MFPNCPRPKVAWHWDVPTHTQVAELPKDIPSALLFAPPHCISKHSVTELAFGSLSFLGETSIVASWMAATYSDRTKADNWEGKSEKDKQDFDRCVQGHQCNEFIKHMIVWPILNLNSLISKFGATNAKPNMFSANKCYFSDILSSSCQMLPDASQILCFHLPLLCF